MNKVDTWDYNAVALMKAALKAPFGVKRLLADPKGSAKSLGFTLDDKLVADIANLKVFDKLPKADEAADEEVADFFHTTVADGRFISEWHDDPAGVASKLQIGVSDDAIKRIAQINGELDLNKFTGPIVEAPIVTVIAVFFAGELRGPAIRVSDPRDIDRI